MAEDTQRIIMNAQGELDLLLANRETPTDHIEQVSLFLLEVANESCDAGITDMEVGGALVRSGLLRKADLTQIGRMRYAIIVASGVFHSISLKPQLFRRKLRATLISHLSLCKELGLLLGPNRPHFRV